MHMAEAILEARQHISFPSLPQGIERDGFVALIDAVAPLLRASADDVPPASRERGPGRRRAAEVLAGRSRSGEEAVERAAGERCGAALCHGGPSERGIFPTPTADRFPRFCR